METNRTFFQDEGLIDLSQVAAVFGQLGAVGGLQRVHLAMVTDDPVDDAHSRNHPRLILGLDGESTCQIAMADGMTPVTLRRGDLLIAPAGAPLWPELGPGYHTLGLLWRQVEQQLYSTRARTWADGRLAIGKAASGPLTLASPTASALLAATETMTGRPPDCPVLLATGRALLAALAERLPAAESEPAPTPGGKARRSYEQIEELIREHFAEVLDRESVGRICRLHPNHVTRLCREFDGRGFVEILRETRLAHAQALLQCGRHTVAEVALLCGFGSANYLARCYRRRFGRAPSEEGRGGPHDSAV